MVEADDLKRNYSAYFVHNLGYRLGLLKVTKSKSLGFGILFLSNVIVNDQCRNFVAIVWLDNAVMPNLNWISEFNSL